MNRIPSLTLIAALLISVAAMAQPRGPRGPEDGRGMRHERMMAMLDLSEEQAAKIADLHLAMRKKMMTHRAEIQKLHTELKLIETADNFDRNKADGLIKDIEKLRTEMMTARVLHHQDVRSLLTDEQKQRFDMHMLSGRGNGVKGGRGACGAGPCGAGPRGGGGQGPHGPRMGHWW